MANSIPKPATETELRWIDANWIIDPIAGTIYSLKVKRFIGCPRPDGYWVVKSINRMFQVHHVIWWKAKGRWPESQLDHEDKNQRNNREGNLREATHSLQMHNRDMGFGVSIATDTTVLKYKAAILFQGKKVQLGRSKVKEEAAELYRRAKDGINSGRVFNSPEELQYYVKAGV